MGENCSTCRCDGEDRKVDPDIAAGFRASLPESKDETPKFQVLKSNIFDNMSMANNGADPNRATLVTDAETLATLEHSKIALKKFGIDDFHQTTDTNNLFNSAMPNGPHRSGSLYLGPYSYPEDSSYYWGEYFGTNRHGLGIKIFHPPPIKTPNPTWQIYSGKFTNDHPHGKGSLIFSDSSLFKGKFQKGQIQGKGSLKTQKSFFQGLFKDGQKSGFGTQTFLDGSKFEGHYSQNTISGTGKFIYADGSVYKGDFFEGKICGKGDFYWADGRSYSGGWKNDVFEGFGVFGFGDGGRYSGEYVGGVKEGYGEFEWKGGVVYKGGWKGGKMCGVGVI
jgi:hypothetical protein